MTSSANDTHSRNRRPFSGADFLDCVIGIKSGKLASGVFGSASAKEAPIATIHER